MKRHGKWIGGLVFGVAALTLTSGALRAGEEGGQKIEKRRIVMIDEDGKEKVIEGDGPMAKRGFLGVGLTELTPELRKHFGAPEGAGVMISQVEDGSPAEKAGLRVGDILTAIDGEQVKSSYDIGARVRKLKEGEQAGIEIVRDGRSQKVTATIAERERPAIDMGPFFFKDKDGDNMVLHLGKDKLMGPGMFDKKLEWKDEDGKEGDGHRVIVRRLGSPREAELEKQLKDLEKRIAELEKALAKKN
jgi:hypothetical protein